MNGFRERYQVARHERAVQIQFLQFSYASYRLCTSESIAQTFGTKLHSNLLPRMSSPWKRRYGWGQLPLLELQTALDFLVF